MKKLIALLLALAMLCSVAAFAEETEVAEIAEPGVSVELDQIVDFSLKLDAIPEGYVYDEYTVDGMIYFTLSNPDDEDALIYAGSVAFSEEFDGYTLVVADLTEEQIAQMEAMIVGDEWLAPTFAFDKTAHGTDVIIVNENDGISDYAEIVTIYQGYFITISLLKAEGQIADSDIAAGVQAMSDIWIVAAE